MTIWFVHRNGGPGTPISYAGQQQPGYADEALDDTTSTELQAFLNPPPTPQQQAAKLIAAGIQIASTGTPALNGTYAIDDGAKAVIDGIYAGIKNGDGLPGGGLTFNYPDASGTFHAFDATSFPNFAKKVRDYLYSISQGAPLAQPVSIP